MLETLRKFISLIQSFSLFDHDVCRSGCFQWPLLFGWIEIEFALTRGYQLTRKGRFIVLVLLTPLFCFRNEFLLGFGILVLIFVWAVDLFIHGKDRPELVGNAMIYSCQPHLNSTSKPV